MITKKSSIVAIATAVVLSSAAFAGGVALKNAFEGKVDTESERHRRLYVGTFREVEGRKPTVFVKMASPMTPTETMRLLPGDFSFDTGNQQGKEAHFADLSEWAMRGTRGLRLDDWSRLGGKISFQSECGGLVSSFRETNYGGGSYFVNVPLKDGGEIVVNYSPIVLQTEGDIR